MTALAMRERKDDDGRVRAPPQARTPSPADVGSAADWTPRTEPELTQAQLEENAARAKALTRARKDAMREYRRAPETLLPAWEEVPEQYQAAQWEEGLWGAALLSYYDTTEYDGACNLLGQLPPKPIDDPELERALTDSDVSLDLTICNKAHPQGTETRIMRLWRRAQTPPVAKRHHQTPLRLLDPLTEQMSQAHKPKLPCRHLNPDPLPTGGSELAADELHRATDHSHPAAQDTGEAERPRITTHVPAPAHSSSVDRRAETSLQAVPTHDIRRVDMRQLLAEASRRRTRLSVDRVVWLSQPQYPADPGEDPNTQEGRSPSPKATQPPEVDSDLQRAASPREDHDSQDDGSPPTKPTQLPEVDSDLEDIPLPKPRPGLTPSMTRTRNEREGPPTGERKATPAEEQEHGGRAEQEPDNNSGESSSGPLAEYLMTSTTTGAEWGMPGEFNVEEESVQGSDNMEDTGATAADSGSTDVQSHGRTIRRSNGDYVLLSGTPPTQPTTSSSTVPQIDIKEWTTRMCRLKPLLEDGGSDFQAILNVIDSLFEDGVAWPKKTEDFDTLTPKQSPQSVFRATQLADVLGEVSGL
ncbi:hypothetical protein MD484_g8430, partial [Candolleomyces efflorescens]